MARGGLTSGRHCGSGSRNGCRLSASTLGERSKAAAVARRGLTKWNPQRLCTLHGDSNGCGAAEGRQWGSGRGALATSGVPRRATKGLHRRRASKVARGGLSHFRLAVDEAEQATADVADVARSERATAVRETGRLERQIPSSACQGSPRLCGGQRLASGTGYGSGTSSALRVRDSGAWRARRATADVLGSGTGTADVAGSGAAETRTAVRHRPCHGSRSPMALAGSTPSSTSHGSLSPLRRTWHLVHFPPRETVALVGKAERGRSRTRPYRPRQAVEVEQATADVCQGGEVGTLPSELTQRRWQLTSPDVADADEALCGVCGACRRATAATEGRVCGSGSRIDKTADSQRLSASTLAALGELPRWAAVSHFRLARWRDSGGV